MQEARGIDPERLLLDWVSAAEGTRFGELVTGFIEKIKELGPIDRSGDFKQRIAVGEAIVESERIRWMVGKELELLEEGNVYHEKMDEDELRKILWENIDQEYDMERICAMIQETPRNVRDIAAKLDMSTSLVFRYLTEMENNGAVTLTEFQGNTPYYLKVKTAAEEGGE